MRTWKLQWSLINTEYIKNICLQVLVYSANAIIYTVCLIWIFIDRVTKFTTLVRCCCSITKNYLF